MVTESKDTPTSEPTAKAEIRTAVSVVPDEVLTGLSSFGARAYVDKNGAIDILTFDLINPTPNTSKDT
jgi:hypothetical protein